MNQEQFEKLVVSKLDDIERRISHLEQEAAWVRGRLEGRGKFWADIKSWIAIVVAIGAAVIAWLK